MVTVTNRSATPQDHRLNLTTRLGSTEGEPLICTARCVCRVRARGAGYGRAVGRRRLRSLRGQRHRAGRRRARDGPHGLDGGQHQFFAQIAVPDDAARLRGAHGEDKAGAPGPRPRSRRAAHGPTSSDCSSNPSSRRTSWPSRRPRGHRCAAPRLGRVQPHRGPRRLDAAALRWFYSLTGIWASRSYC